VSVLRRFREERGEVGLISALLLLAGVLLPLMFLVVAFARIEQGRLAAAQAARDAVRAAVQAPSATQAQQAADDALAREQAQTSTPLALQLEGSFARGAVLRATTTAQVQLGSLPFVGRFGTIVVHGTASAPVDSYRSILASSP
jgi:Flp pilus assembly protein TadG